MKWDLLKKHIKNAVKYLQKLIVRSEDSSLTFEGACSYVTQLSDLYDECKWDQLTPGLSALLDQSIEVIRKNVGKAKWVQMTLDEALWLKEHMPEIKFFKYAF